MKEYGLYDIKDYEQLVFSGTLKEIANFLECSTNSLRSYMSHKKRGDINGLIKKDLHL